MKGDKPMTELDAEARLWRVEFADEANRPDQCRWLFSNAKQARAHAKLLAERHPDRKVTVYKTVRCYRSRFAAGSTSHGRPPQRLPLVRTTAFQP